MFEIVAGDLEPAIDIDLTVNGVAQDVSDATGPILMHWRKPDGTEVSVTMSAVNLVLGQVAYQWVSSDTAIAGVHRAQVVVPRPNGPQTFPGDGAYVRWVVHPKI